MEILTRFSSEIVGNAAGEKLWEDPKKSCLFQAKGFHSYNFPCIPTGFAEVFKSRINCVNMFEYLLFNLNNNKYACHILTTWLLSPCQGSTQFHLYFDRFLRMWMNERHRTESALIIPRIIKSVCQMSFIDVFNSFLIPPIFRQAHKLYVLYNLPQFFSLG